MFILRYARYGGRYEARHETLEEALDASFGMEETGEAFPYEITDENGITVMDGSTLFEKWIEQGSDEVEP